MENILKIDKMTNLEEQIARNVNLLEIAKSYCEFHYDKSKEISILISILDIILDGQKKLMDSLENKL